MNYEITENDLQQAGISLPPDQAKTILTQMNATLAERVGTEITESLTDEELDTMMNLQQGGDESALGEWIGQHVADLNEIVEDERALLLGEIADSIDKTES